jgi:hypothetical protein
VVTKRASPSVRSGPARELCDGAPCRRELEANVLAAPRARHARVAQQRGRRRAGTRRSRDILARRFHDEHTASDGVRRAGMHSSIQDELAILMERLERVVRKIHHSATY